MAGYRLYCIDGTGKFTKVHEIIADNDVAAIEEAAEKS